jgi:hypothetical protein
MPGFSENGKRRWAIGLIVLSIAVGLACVIVGDWLIVAAMVLNVLAQLLSLRTLRRRARTSHSPTSG